MKQTQINSETYVNACDVADWMEADIDKIEKSDPFTHATIRSIALALRAWAKAPERRKGVPNLTMPTIQ